MRELLWLRLHWCKRPCTMPEYADPFGLRKNAGVRTYNKVFKETYDKTYKEQLEKLQQASKREPVGFGIERPYV